MKNRLLTGLDARDLDALKPHLSDLDLPVRLVLQQPGIGCEHVDFVEAGIVSIMSVSGSNRIEIGLVGVEGLVGIPAILGAAEGVHETVVQTAGRALRIRTGDLRRCMAASPTLTGTLLRYAHVTLAQISQTALANGRNTVEQRLARWLLMAHDRLGGNEITLTHELLAATLGVRRPGVTVALHLLEGAHAIRSRRASIVITDREKLKAVAGPSYGAPEDLYHKLFGRLSASA